VIQPVRSSTELSCQMQPLAERLRVFTEPLTGDESRPAMQQLVPLAGEIAVLVADMLNPTGDPLGTGRHNLATLRGLAARAGRGRRAGPARRTGARAIAARPCHPPW
jgi:hypothetical protein